ncbi:MAG: carboxypeptidase-like regulatory domain-containing protein [Bacteroidia bacterium]|nr:carboxypeptidase-like regulatory domain-containing protein [Bacteroidia bacterium]
MKTLLTALCGLLFICAAEVHAQLSLAIQMDPRPSPYISDWRSNPNTIRFIVTNPTNADVQVRFYGYIEGDTRGRVAESNIDAPIPPVTIRPGTSMLNAVDANMLEDGAVAYSGPTREESRRSGRLPEDNFRLCVELRAYDPPWTALSPEACTRFDIRLLFPPTLIAPVNASDVTAAPTFQWSGVPLAIGEMAKYELTVIELDPGQTNVAQAMKTNIPLMQRSDLRVPVYQVMPSDPKFEEKHRYAWQVRAYDVNERFTFANDGVSEIWSFTYNPPVPPGFTDKTTKAQVKGKVSPPSSSAFSQLNTTPHLVSTAMARLRGRLLSTFNPSSVPKPRSLTISDAPVKPAGKGKSPVNESKAQQGTVKPAVQTGQKTPSAQAAQTLKVSQLPNVISLFGKKSLPMGGIHLSLYLHTRSVPVCGYWPFRVNGTYYPDKVLVATTTTTEDGSFEFVFFAKDSTGRIFKNVDIHCGGGEFVNTLKGDLYRYYTVEVNDPHLCSPEDEFAVQPLGNEDAGDLYSLVRSYAAKIHVVDKEVPDVSLSGMRVAVIRRNRPNDVPENEGTLDPPEPRPFPLSGEIIARGETDKDGILTIRDMVKNVGGSDYYDIMVANPEESVYWYASTVRTFKFGFLLNEKDEEGNTLTWDMATYNQDYDPDIMKATVKLAMTPKNPRIKGKVYRADNLIQPLKNAKVSLYRFSGILTKDRETVTNDSGGFVFDNLIPTSGSSYYFMKIERYGYKTRIEPVNLSTDPIKLPKGRQRTFAQIPLTPKLVVHGKIVDEFGRPVAATIRIGTGNDVHTIKKMKILPAQQSSTQLIASLVQQNPMVQSSSVASRLKYRPRPKLAKLNMPKVTFDEEFTTPAPTGLQYMYIMPDNIELYHPDTLMLFLPEGAEDLGDFTVYVKAHRLAVRAVTTPPSTQSPPGLKIQGAKKAGKQTKKQGQVGPSIAQAQARVNMIQAAQTPPAMLAVNQFLTIIPQYTWVIKDAVITVNGMEPDSVDADGVSYFVWFSPGDDAEIQVKGPPDSDYMEKTVQATVGDESIHWLEMSVPLLMGGRISGKVSVGTVAVQGARVRLFDNPAETEPLQTYTDAAGTYTLRGIAPGNHLFLAAKSKSQFIGDTASADIVAGKEATLDFELSTYNDMDITTLLGFPIEVSGLDSSSGQVRLSGSFVELPANAHFSPEDSSNGLPFTDVAVQPSSAANPNGIPYAEPATLPLVTPVNSWDITAFDVYKAEQHDNVQGLRVDRGDGRGEIRGAVRIKPSSFTFPGGSVELGVTHIALARSVGTSEGLVIPALTSDAGLPHDGPRGYHAVAEDGSALRFSLYDFDAVTDSARSYFHMDTVSLATTLHTNISNIEKSDLELDIGAIRVHHNAVEPIVSPQALDITLEGDWKIASKAWTLDNNGLTLDSGTVRAGYIGVPFKGLKIFPDAIAFGDFSLDKLLMSGVATINVTGKADFGFDPGTQHWSLAVGPKPGEETCGWMLPLSPMAPTDRIMFQNFYVQASGSKGFQMATGNHVTLGRVGSWVINQFIPKETFVQIAGSLDLGIPNLPIINQIATVGEEDGDIVLGLDPINETIAVNGVKIKFNTAKGQQNYDNNGLHAGVIVSEDGAFALHSILHRTPTKTHIVVNEGEEVQVGTEVKMTDVVGAMEVASNAWQLFWFEGDLQNKDQGGRLKFTVMGDIVANNQQIGVDKIETPFGDISLIYNFQEAQLEGTLHVEQDLDGTKIVGDATLLISGAGKGWYFFCGATFELPQPKVDGTAAFAVGHFKLTQKQLDQFAEYSYQNKGLPPQFHNFNGFFFEGTVMIPPPVFCPNFDFDFGLVSAYMICQVGANARFGMNFGPVDTYFIAIRGIGKLEAGVGMSVVIACAGVSAGILIEPNIEGMYQSDGTWYVLGDFPITLYGTTYAGWGICDSECDGALCDKSSASASITLGMKGYVGSDDKYFKFYFK